MHRSVYRLAGAPTTWRQLAMAATLAGGDGTYAAHRTAAALHPLFKTFGGIVEVVSEGTPRLHGIAIKSHRTFDLPAVDQWTVDRIPTVALNRTLIDVGRYWDYKRVKQLLDHATRDGLTSYKAFEARVHALAKQGRNGIGTARQVLQSLGMDGTWGFEAAMRRALHEAGLPKPKREHRIEVGEQRHYIDFAYPEAKLGIECDSVEWHTLPSQVAADDRRRNRINGSGFLLLSYTCEQLRFEKKEVIDEIAFHLRERTQAS